MSPVLINGRRLGVERNGIFSAANTDPIPGGKLWNGSGGSHGDLGAALAWNDLRDYIAAKTGVWIAPAGDASSARTFGQQQQMRAMWCGRGDCSKAAVPGTSNHGWAIAVDGATPIQWAMLMRYGPMFGWSHDEGARVGEPWHFRYVGGYTRRITIDPLDRKERRLVDAFDDASRERRDRILDWIAEDIRAIRSAARAERGGWGHRGRGARYAKLTDWFNARFPRFLTDDEHAMLAAYYGASAGEKAKLLARIAARVRSIRAQAEHTPDGWGLHDRRERYDYLSAFYNHRHR